MGRITIFALEDCPHCHRTKQALQQRQIPYTEISLSTHPHRRTDMLQLSDRLSVPQVFFNDQHVGGADETLALLKQWDARTAAASSDKQAPLQVYQEQIESQPDPTDPRLQPSTDPPVTVKPPPPRPDSDLVALPAGSATSNDNGNGKPSSISVLDLTERLKKVLAGRRIKTFGMAHNHAFTLEEAMDALQEEFKIQEGAATSFFTLLLERQIIQPIGKVKAKNTNNQHLSKLSLYRLQCYHTPNILNSYRIWDTTVVPSSNDDPMGLLQRLKKLLSKIEASVTSDKGVNYRDAAKHADFCRLEEGLCELQGIDMSDMDVKTKIAFGINLYNLMIKFSFMKVGIYNNLLGLMAYFNVIQFNVGGLLLSFHDLESGVLRGNRKAPYAPFVPFHKQDDARRKLVLPSNQVDPRIHFGLNCGAKSCPPVKQFSPDALEEELRIVAMAFCDDLDHVKVDTQKQTLWVSQILQWYHLDFTANGNSVAETVLTFLRGDSHSKLEAMLKDGKRIRIRYLPYDWTTNASDFVPFRKVNIQADQRLFLGWC